MRDTTRLAVLTLGILLVASLGPASADAEEATREGEVSESREGESLEVRDSVPETTHETAPLETGESTPETPEDGGVVPTPGPVRSETLRWTHVAPSEVRSFKVRWGTRPGVYQATLDVGKPPLTGGVFATAIDVPATETVYVALSAVGTNGLESILSNVGIRTPQGSGGGSIGEPGRPQISP